MKQTSSQAQPQIVMLCAQSEFSAEQQQRLSQFGKVKYINSAVQPSQAEILKLTKEAQVIAVTPDTIGGFEQAAPRLSEILQQSTHLKGIALDTTSYGYVDMKYCQRNDIKVTHVPKYSTESVAEQVIAFLLIASKHIIEEDRLTQADKYTLMQGRDLRGKTLGIIGLGHIGARVAQLAQGFGMQVIAWNRTPKSEPGVTMLSLDTVLRESDFLSLHLTDGPETHHFLSVERLKLLKHGVIIVNTADRGLIDEKALAKALKTHKVGYYVLEAEDLSSPPLGQVPNALMFKSFGWYTKESIEQNRAMWLDNIIGLIQGNPPNRLV